eukprot:6277409-Ditylum_brightwellii.AAC.1
MAAGPFGRVEGSHHSSGLETHMDVSFFPDKALDKSFKAQHNQDVLWYCLHCSKEKPKFHLHLLGCNLSRR